MLTVIIVDDKPLAVELLQGYLAKIPFAECKASFTNALEALGYMEAEKPDIVLLDIQMPDITGIQLMKIAGDKTRYILVTAYPDYAVEGFEHNAIDYLLKPVSFERFYAAMQKARSLPAGSHAAPPLPSAMVSRDFLFLKTERMIRKIDYRDILYVEAKQNYVEVHTVAEKLLALQTMKQTEDMLPPALFFRIHKSYIINISSIRAIEQHMVHIGTATLPIGEAYRQNFYRLLENG